MGSDLEGLTAVVTGGAGQTAGLGRGLVRGFAESGMRIAVLDVDTRAASALASELRGDGVDAIGLEADVTSPASLDSAASEVASTFGACNVLCAHVGGGGQGRLVELSLDTWSRAMELMVTGTVATVLAFLPLMRQSEGRRRIVLTSSVAALAPGRFQGPYRAAKAAVMSIGETLDLELAGEGIGTTVAFPSGMLSPELMALAGQMIGVPGDPDSAEPETLEMAIAGEMVTDPSDLAEGEGAAAPVVAAVLAGRRYVITHGRTVETTYMSRHRLLEEAFAELADRSYRPTGVHP